MKTWRQTPAVPAGTGGPCPRLEAPLLPASQICPIPGKELMSEQGKGLYRCREVLKLRHKPQALKLPRRTAREAWCSCMGVSYKGPDCPNDKRVSDPHVLTDSQELAKQHPKIERFQRHPHP